MDQRRCRVCEETKPLSQFPSRNRVRPTGTYVVYAWECKKCKRTRVRNQKYSVPEGYVPPQRCPICRKTLPKGRGLHYDHDHETGEFRSALCGNCNALLGFAQDSPIILRSALRYLRKHSGTS